jgi:hypothetical protein
VVNQSPYELLRSLENELNGILSGQSVYDLPPVQQKMIARIRREVNEARLDVRDYQSSETKPAQAKFAKQATKRLRSIGSILLAASTYNIFSAIDVALISAKVEQIIAIIE